MTLKEFVKAALHGEIEKVNQNIGLLTSPSNRYKLKETDFLAQLQKRKQQDIFEICIKALEPSSDTCERLLFIAISQKNLRSVKLLLTEHHARVSFSHLDKALSFSEKEDIQIACYLIKQTDRNFFTPIHNLFVLPGARESIKICNLLVDKLKLKANKENFMDALDDNNDELFHALLSASDAKYFYKIINDNDIETAEEFLKNLDISKLEMEMLMLYCAKKKKFNMAKIISKWLVNKQNSSSTKIDDPRLEIFLWETDLELPSAKRETIERVLNEIYLFLSDGRACLYYLRELDQKIAEYQTNLSVDFSKIIPQNFVIREGLKWPVPPENYNSIKCYSLLKILMRESLISSGVECSEEMTTFCGFVEGELANQLVLQARVFNEHYLYGNVLYHGLLSHFIQIYLIKRAIEMGKISTSYPDNSESLSLPEILKAFIHFSSDQQEYRDSFWNHVLDAPSEENPFLMNFTRPEILNQALFWVNSLPYLRGYWVNYWYRKTEQYLTEANRQNTEPLSFEVMVLLNAITSPYFVSFNPFNQDTIANYYESRPECNFNKETSIVTKPWKTRYQFWGLFLSGSQKEESDLTKKAVANPLLNT